MSYQRNASVATALALMLTGACAGRDAHPVAAYRTGDGYLTCAAIDGEMEQIRTAVVPLYDQAGDKTGWNVGWGLVGGLLFWPALFALDLSDAEMQEVRAYQARWDNLMRMRDERGCSGAAPAMFDADGRVVRAATPPSDDPPPTAAIAPAMPTDTELWTMSVQTALAERNYYNGPIDGRMGRKFRNALMRYQSQSNLPVTGKLDPKTLQSLGISD